MRGSSALLKTWALPLDAAAIRRLVAEHEIEMLDVVLAAIAGEPFPDRPCRCPGGLARFRSGAEPVPVFPLRGADLVEGGFRRDRRSARCSRRPARPGWRRAAGRMRLTRRICSGGCWSRVSAHAHPVRREAIRDALESELRTPATSCRRRPASIVDALDGSDQAHGDDAERYEHSVLVSDPRLTPRMTAERALLHTIPGSAALRPG